jgi:hypothetical protein
MACRQAQPGLIGFAMPVIAVNEDELPDSLHELREMLVGLEETCEDMELQKRKAIVRKKSGIELDEDWFCRLTHALLWQKAKRKAVRRKIDAVCVALKTEGGTQAGERVPITKRHPISTQADRQALFRIFLIEVLRNDYSSEEWTSAMDEANDLFKKEIARRKTSEIMIA